MRTGRQLEALAAGDHRHLREATVARIEQPPASTLGMCGHLSPYQPDPAAARDGEGEG